MTQEKTPVEEWREEFDNKRQGWNTNYPVLRTHSQAVFAAAAKMLLRCGVRRNQPVGILIDEGGWLFSQMMKQWTREFVAETISLYLKV